MTKSKVMPKLCGLRKLSDDLKNFAAGKFKASQQRMFSVTLAKLSSDEGYHGLKKR
jgi:hypothetical protein